MVRVTFKFSNIKAKQLARILSLYTFDEDKVDLIKELKPKIIDRYNSVFIYNTINGLLTRDEVAKLLQE